MKTTCKLPRRGSHVGSDQRRLLGPTAATPRVSWPLRYRGRLACTRSLERRTAGCVLFVTCYLLPTPSQIASRIVRCSSSLGRWTASVLTSPPRAPVSLRCRGPSRLAGWLESPPAGGASVTFTYLLFPHSQENESYLSAQDDFPGFPGLLLVVGAGITAPAALIGTALTPTRVHGPRAAAAAA